MIRSHRWRSVLLGSFVLFQFIYLPLANLMQLVPREMPEPHGELDIRVQREGTFSRVRAVQESANGLGTLFDRYGELTGQVQAWSLFAQFGTHSLFPVVECSFVDRVNFTEITIEPNWMPDDPDRYFRWPTANSRLYGYEFLLAAIYWRYSEESLREHGPEWRRALSERVRDQRKSFEAYFRWNLKLLRTNYPDRPLPETMVLNVRVFPSPPPGETLRPASFLLPLARWYPERTPQPGFLPIEAYDPLTKQFVSLPIEDDR